jgi:hypothetical protein
MIDGPEGVLPRVLWVSLGWGFLHARAHAQRHQIIFVEFLAMMFLASVVATLMARRGILGCAGDLEMEGF